MEPEASQPRPDTDVDAKGRKVRPHPFADEHSTAEEESFNPVRVTLIAASLATFMAVMGLWLQGQYGHLNHDVTRHASWETWTRWPLFTGLALLAFGFVPRPWAKRFTIAGWILFAFYWAMTAKDLFIKESQDYFNFAAALVGVYFFTYLAYHEWLSLVRRVDNHAVRFLNITAFIAAGSYFLIAKVQFLRIWLIHLVGNHTKWSLDLFGQGDKANLVFLVDKNDAQGPVTFFYPEYYCDPAPFRNDGVGQWCAQHQDAWTNSTHLVTNTHTYAQYTPTPSGWLDNILMYEPGGGSWSVLPVSIILACTAIQSIMLFVGFFFGTQADWRKKVKMSLIVGAVVYVLNLIRNTGIIWFYGQGHSSFWVMHNAIGKGGSLLAMIGIAFAVFKWFPEFFKSLVSVLDLIDRDGPIERTLKIGRRRPEKKFPGEE